MRLDDTLDDALGLVKHRITRAMPVVDYYGKLHSVLSLGDAVAHLDYGPLAGMTASDVLGLKRRAEVAKDNASGAGWREQLSAYLLRSAETHTVSSRTSVVAAAEHMLRERLSFLVVVDPPTDQDGQALRKRAVCGVCLLYTSPSPRD